MILYPSIECLSFKKKKKIVCLAVFFCGTWLFLSILRKMMQSWLEFTFSNILWDALILTALTRCTGVCSRPKKKTSTGFSELILNQSSISFNPPEHLHFSFHLFVIILSKFSCLKGNNYFLFFFLQISSSRYCTEVEQRNPGWQEVRALLTVIYFPSFTNHIKTLHKTSSKTKLELIDWKFWNPVGSGHTQSFPLALPLSGIVSHRQRPTGPTCPGRVFHTSSKAHQL